MPHPPIIIPPITKTCPTCHQTKPEDQFRRVGTNTAVKNCLACRDRYRPGRKRLSEESVVVFDSTPLPTNSNTSTNSYQPITPRPTQPVPHGGEQEHRTQNVFRVEPPKRKKENRKKKDNHEEEPQLVEIGSMVLGPMGPSFALLPSLQSNSRSQSNSSSRENRSGTREQSIRTVESTGPEPQPRASSRPQTGHGTKVQGYRNKTVDLTGPESQSWASSRSVPPHPPTSDGGLDVRSMVLGPMGPSIAVLPSVQSKPRSQRISAETREQRVRTVDLTTGPEPQSRNSSSRPLPLRPQIEQTRERHTSTVDLTEPEPQSRSSSRPMPSRPRIEHDAKTRERLRNVNPTEPGPQSQGSSTQSLFLRPQEHSSGSREQWVKTVISTEPQFRDSSSQSMPPRPQTEHGAERERQVRTINSTEPEPQPRDASSQPPPLRPPTNEGDLEKYVSKCWDVGCTSCRSYSLRH
ncbi:uncharacterized protein ASPGLDRAFT_34126 [Aspergillus glaucus CBS 516.65]|uniref:Uncharacterized protein n=1 Tax=Aspergillus glaucus CBS 516.65 TaxID=1160497 RepID=A0A1L9VQN5_ASPGL|nr:hypothetical protein ASPGLDRAFT_34126 [Aspergillus glaucus CBS 516.65]OJJ86235.1 hypothetical protein ASPGLDRAFT_34126 [Aspergillus glaucus CBS 516.65]